jgi:DNA-binding CsgD family transcriptional regulator
MCCLSLEEVTEKMNALSSVVWTVEMVREVERQERIITRKDAELFSKVLVPPPELLFPDQIIKEEDRLREAEEAKKLKRLISQSPRAGTPGPKKRNIRSLLFRILGSGEDLEFSITEEEMYLALQIIMRETGIRPVAMEYLDRFWFGGKSQKEVAETMGKSHAAVVAGLMKLYRKLRHPSRSRAIYYVIHGWDVDAALERASHWLTDVNWRVSHWLTDVNWRVEGDRSKGIVK